MSSDHEGSGLLAFRIGACSPVSVLLPLLNTKQFRIYNANTASKFEMKKIPEKSIFPAIEYSQIVRF